MDAVQWPQELGLVNPMEDLVSSTTTTNSTRPQVMERRARPQKEQALNCPRCNSTNTKFCYYNNYSLTQPRYFCKTCRRYWTEGGSLRNVPVGGGSRKNKRSSSSSSSLITPPSTTTTATSISSSANPKFHEAQDLNLAYAHHSSLPADFGEFPNMESSRRNRSSNCTNPSTSMEFLRSGISGRGVVPFLPMSMSMPMAPDESAVYPSGFGLQDFRPPTLNFPLDGIGGAAGSLQGVQESGGRLLFPFEDLKQVTSSTADFEQNRGQGGDHPGFWNGMIGGGSW